MPSRSQDAPLQAPDSRVCLVRTWGNGSTLVRMWTDGECPRQKYDVLVSLYLTEL